MTTAALLVAAGRGQRFGRALPKQYAALAGRPVLRHAALSLLQHPGIDHVVAVIHRDDRALYDSATDGLALGSPVIGGATRQQSVQHGLQALAALGPQTVLIHDAARPLLPADVIDRVLAAVGPGTGAIAALPVHDSLRRALDGTIGEELDRTGVWRAQTPQGFRFEEILHAHSLAEGAEHSDDASIARAAGLAVAVVDGAEENFKITTSGDLARAEALLRQQAERCHVGMGFDVHRFGPGQGVRIGGLDIAHDQSLIGHSDADVALHALTDAILGAVGAGDIGQLFPPTDMRWRGADSALFLAEAVARVQARGGHIGNLDLTVICERPKIGPHREAMRARIADIAGLEPTVVNVKATTTERLGFTGRGEGIAAQAVATVWLPA